MVTKCNRTATAGQIIIVVAVSLVVLIGFVGLAIDSGRGYGVKAKLSSAVDAAAIAAGRSLAVGNDDATRLANAQAAGRRYYEANFPDDYLGATRKAATIDAVHDPLGFWTVTASGSADMPVTFLRVLGFTDVAVASIGKAIRRDVDVMLVLDTSGSLGPPTSPANTLPRLKQAAIDHFVSRFASGSGGDRVGLVSFASGAVLDVAINKDAARGFDRTTATNQINALDVQGSTAQAEGLRRAVDELNQVPVAQRSSLRTIVFFSDGAPNDVSATFNLSGGGQVTGDLYSETDPPASNRANRVWENNRRNNPPNGNTHNDIASLPQQGLGNINLSSYDNMRPLGSSPYANTRCNVNKAARNMAENIANTARDQGILIMTIGLGERLNSLEINFCGYSASEYGSNILNRFANQKLSDTYNDKQPEGIYCFAGDSTQLDTCFDRIANAILRLTM